MCPFVTLGSRIRTQVRTKQAQAELNGYISKTDSNPKKKKSKGKNTIFPNPESIGNRRRSVSIVISIRFVKVPKAQPASSVLEAAWEREVFKKKVKQETNPNSNPNNGLSPGPLKKIGSNYYEKTFGPPRATFTIQTWEISPESR